MRQEQSKVRRRIGLFLFLVIAQVLMVAALWSHHHVIVSAYDRAVTDVGHRWLGRGTVGHEREGGLRALILYSETTARQGANDEHLRALVEQWQTLLVRERISTSVESILPSVDGLLRYDLVVLPAVSCLSTEEIDGIKAFLRQGGGLIMTWAAGVRDEHGQWREDSLLAHVGGMTLASSEVLDPDSAEATLQVVARSPLTSGLPPGLRFRVQSYGDPLAATVREPRALAAAAWSVSPAQRHSVSPIESSDRSAGLVHGNYFAGRYVWLGLTDLAALSQPDLPQAPRRLLTNMIYWASRLPQASQPIWPQHAQSAFSLSIVAADIADVDAEWLVWARSERVPITIFVPENLMGRDALPPSWSDPSIALALLDELPGARQDIGSVRSEMRRLRTIRRRVGSGRNPLGYRAADGQASEGLQDRLVRAGFAYWVGRDPDLLSPFVARAYRPVPWVTRQREMWQIPEVTHQVLQKDRPGSASLVDAFARTHQAGGLFHLVIDARGGSAVPLIELESLLFEIGRQNVWVASVGDVHAHWQIRDHLDIATTRDATGRVTVHISNSGQSTARTPNFFIDLSTYQEDIYLRPLTLGSPHLASRSSDGFRWELTLGTIPPGKNYSYHLITSRPEQLREPNPL